jgi:hypothetical protein
MSAVDTERTDQADRNLRHANELLDISLERFRFDPGAAAGEVLEIDSALRPRKGDALIDGFGGPIACPRNVGRERSRRLRNGLQPFSEFLQPCFRRQPIRNLARLLV